MKDNKYKITPFLSMNGKAKEAIKFYEKHLNAQIVFLMTYNDLKKTDANIKFDESKGDYVNYSVLVIGENKLYISDEIMSREDHLSFGNSMSLCFESSSPDTIQEIYNSITSDDQVKVIVPLTRTFFSPAFGMIKDPFGILIQLSTENNTNAA